jgi:hypothetical protein
VFICCTTPSVALTRAGSRTASTPKTRTSPSVGRTRVVMIPIVVDLPGAVGPEEAEDLPVADLEVDAGDGGDRRLTR